MNNTFFIGIVESVEDPLKLNRVQVRVFGVHTEALDDVPTEKLPWAICLVANAAVSGIGTSGTQYMRGSAVMVVFKDQDSKQQPIILGGFHGVPVDISPFKGEEQVIDHKLTLNAVEYKLDVVESDIIDEVGVPVESSATTGEAKPIPTKEEQKKETSAKSSVDARTALKDALGKRESSNNYRADNQFGYVGKYQMGHAYLADRGYMKLPVVKPQSKESMADPKNWTGKDGIKNAEDFKNNPTIQEKAMDAGLDANEKQLTRLKVIDANSTEQEKAGFLATSHLVGVNSAVKLKRSGDDVRDGNGVAGSTYYNLGYKAVAGKNPKVAPDKNTLDNPSREPSPNPDVGRVKNPKTRLDSVGLETIDVTAGGTEAVATSDLGFQDPEEEFPRYFDEQDTNRLARNQNIGETIVPYKESLEHKNVPKANGKGMWDQSPTPYNAKYPFNVVHETQSGHVVELDDTPDNERIHMYHKTGTFEEVDCNGTLVRRIVGDAYEVWDRNGYIHIKGTCNITIDGNANILVANDCELEVDGDLNANVGGNSNWSIGGDANYTVGKDVNWNVGGTVKNSIKKDLNFTVEGALNSDITKNVNNVVKGSVNNNVKGNVNDEITGDNVTRIGGADTNSVGGNYMITTGGAEHHTNAGVNATTSPSILMTILPVIGASAAVPAVPAAAAAAEVAKKLAPPPATAQGVAALGELTIPPRNIEELTAFEEEDITPDEVENLKNDLESKGLYTPEPETIPIDTTKVEKIVPDKIKVEPVTCGTFVSGKININDYISPNFRLRDLTGGKALPLEYVGLKDVEIACNLKALATNVLEPIKAKYPNMIINSGWRTIIAKGAGAKSDHPKGMAADISFSKLFVPLVDVAKDIAKTVPCGQMILEYTANSSGWIHVSFGGASTPPFTMYAHGRKGEMGQLLDKDTAKGAKKV